VEEKWIKVAVAPNETLALLMEGLLQDAGVPSLIQRAPGFDVPDFLSAGPRDVLVPGAYLEEARQILEDTTGLAHTCRSGTRLDYRVFGIPLSARSG